MGTIASVRQEANAVWYEIEAAPSLLRLVVEKGSVALDGISLTVASVSDASFTVSVIPHTREQTTLASKGVGDKVNMENDVIGKYVERLLPRASPGKDELWGKGWRQSEGESVVTGPHAGFSCGPWVLGSHLHGKAIREREAS